MENNKNKKSVKFQGDMLNFYDFIQVFVFTRNHHLKAGCFGGWSLHAFTTASSSLKSACAKPVLPLLGEKCFSAHVLCSELLHVMQMQRSFRA